MKAIFNTRPERLRNPRDILLSESLLRAMREMVPHQLSELILTPEEDDGAQLDNFLRLSALPVGRLAKPRLFVGLSSRAEDHLGRNTLICTRSLGEELGDFAGRHGLDMKTDGSWMQRVLGNYERIVFLDRGHFSQSVGLACWAELTLVDRFPILPNRTLMESPIGKPRVLLIDHRPLWWSSQSLTDIYEPLSDMGELLMLNGSEDFGMLAEKLSADIHIHHGVSNDLNSAISPIDSLLGGAYTVILAEMENGRPLIGDEIKHEVEIRSYARIVEDHADALAFAEETIRRTSILSKSELATNPEFNRYERLNESFIAQKITYLKDLTGL